jgi:glycosyltransferase involved in cell wall biosynthesis
VPPRDAASLAAAIRRLIDDRPLARAMGERGRKRAEAVFSRERTIEAFKTLVETTVRTPELLDQRLAHAETI